HYSAENFVTKNEYNALNQQLILERDSLKDVLLRLNLAEIKLKDSSERTYENGEDVPRLNLVISEQTSLISLLRSQLDSARSSSLVGDEAAVNELQAKLNEAVDYVNKFRTISKSWKGKY